MHRTIAGRGGQPGWELTTASATSGKLDDIVRLRSSSECPGVTHAMTFDVWADPAVITAEIDFVGPVDVTLSQTDLRALGLGSFRGGASMWGGAALVYVAPQTPDPPRPCSARSAPERPFRGKCKSPDATAAPPPRLRWRGDRYLEGRRARSRTSAGNSRVLGPGAGH